MLVGLLLGLATLPALAQTAEPPARGSPAVGLTLARANCGQCHAVTKVGPSPLAAAPPFRELHKRYPVEDLAESLAEGITTGHPSMPEYRMEPDQIENLIAHLKTLEQP